MPHIYLHQIGGLMKCGARLYYSCSLYSLSPALMAKGNRFSSLGIAQV